VVTVWRCDIGFRNGVLRRPAADFPRFLLLSPAADPALEVREALVQEQLHLALLALVRPQPGADGAALIRALEEITATWRPADRPRRWRLCADLAPNAAGKWERSRWRRWFIEV